VKKKEQEELATKVYQYVNGIRDVPEIARLIFGKDAKVGTKDFFKICDVVDKLTEEGLVYFRSSDGILLDLQR
jgi:hypothetical protein